MRLCARLRFAFGVRLKPMLFASFCVLEIERVVNRGGSVSVLLLFFVKLRLACLDNSTLVDHDKL